MNNKIFDNWYADYRNICSAHKDEIISLLETTGFIARVSDECFAYLMGEFEHSVRKGLAENMHVLFTIQIYEGWLNKHHLTFKDELKPHFIKMPGLWYYMYRYDVKKINPRTGEVDKALQNAWNVMDNWDIPHAHVEKIVNTWKIVDPT